MTKPGHEVRWAQRRAAALRDQVWSRLKALHPRYGQRRSPGYNPFNSICFSQFQEPDDEAGHFLEDILLRNLPADADASDVDIHDEAWQCFYFDQIADRADLEEAWSVFPEQQEIRRRLVQLESVAVTIPGFGYRVAKKENRCELEDLRRLIEQQLRSIGPLIPDQDYCAQTRLALARPIQVVRASGEEPVPVGLNNELRAILYGAIQDAIEFQTRQDHYHLLREWAVYLTKCDEVAFYLLWPCLKASRKYPQETPDAGFRLWCLSCDDRFWFKNNDPSSGIVHFRPPWLDGAPKSD